MLGDFCDRFNNNTLSIFSSMKCLCPHEMHSHFYSNEEFKVDFDKLFSHFKGDFNDENIKGHYKIELDQLNIYLKEKIKKRN